MLPAVWNVGPRNPGFVGRDAALAAVRERLRAASTTVVQALHGMGGVGKTQLAIEYAHRYADAYDLVWWVDAETTSLLGEQYAALAGELGLVGPRADTTSAVTGTPPGPTPAGRSGRAVTDLLLRVGTHHPPRPR